jgi:antirestriction protein ArdC
MLRPRRNRPAAGEGESEKTKLVPMMREYTVFNVEQCDGLPNSMKTGKQKAKKRGWCCSLKK